MNARKRPGQPLESACNPKQPRRTLVGHDGNAPSPSQGGLAHRWYGLVSDLGNLCWDTFTFTFTFMAPGKDSDDSSDDLTLIHSSPRTHTSQNSQSSNTSTAYESDPPPPSGSRRPAAIKSSIRPEDIPLPPSPQKPTFKRATSPPRSKDSIDDGLFKNASNQSTPRRKSGSSFTAVVSPESSQTSSPTGRVLKENITPALRELHIDGSTTSQDDWASSSFVSDNSTASASHVSRRTSKSLKQSGSRPKGKTRVHIYQNVHKAKVKREHQEFREWLTNELYKAARGKGFSSDRKDFESFLLLQSQLENLDNISTTPSAPGILSARPRISSRTLEVEHVDPKRHTRFLQESLAKFRATVAGAKPQKPFSPTLDQLITRHRLKDDAIEKRLRPPAKALPPTLPEADENFVTSVLNNKKFTSKVARESVGYDDITRLRPRQWLNDEIINFYGSMLNKRAAEAADLPAAKRGSVLNAQYLTSFFYTKFRSDRFKGVAKWTKKFDVFTKDILLFPVNHNNAHWTAAAINFRKRRFESYDSMGMAKAVVFQFLRSWVDSEHRDKKHAPFDFTGWEDWAPETTPQQENGYDCGVFTCQFMEALARGQETFNFSQRDMPYLRRAMVWELANSKLRDDR